MERFIISIIIRNVATGLVPPSGKMLPILTLGEFISPQSLEGIWKCRIAYGKAIEEITYVPYQRRKVSSLRLVTSDTIDYTYKSTNREELNSLYAQRETADRLY